MREVERKGDTDREKERNGETERDRCDEKRNRQRENDR